MTANNSVSIVDVGTDFYICTDDDSVEVTIAAKDDFDLVKPDPYNPPITINAGDSEDYAVAGIAPETMDGAGTIYFVKVDLVRNAPDNPCPIGSGIDYECNVYPASVAVDNYDWSYVLNCKTASTDPYECPEAAGHNTVGVGPDGSSEDKWVSSIFGLPYWSHAGEHELKCKVTIAGHQFTASMIQEVLPKIEVTNVTLDSPAVDKLWPYDPVWHDQDWAATINGTLAVTCALDVDQATVNYKLNKIADNVDIEVFQNVWGWSNICVEWTPNGTTAKGLNSVTCWSIDDEDIDDYFATVTATGNLSLPADVDDADSPNVDIKRRDIFTSDATTPLVSGPVGMVWEYTATLHTFLINSGYTTAFAVGSYYTLAYYGVTSVWAVIGSSQAGVIFNTIMPSSSAPAWMVGGPNGENWTYDYGPWKITQWWWDASSVNYKYGYHPVSEEWTQWDISATEIYSNTMPVPPPANAGVLDRQFLNHDSWGAFDEADMIKTPWDGGLNNNTYGLACPHFQPAAPSVP